jgi:hypothetical protein
VARADITPPVGIYAHNWGAARHTVAEGIHRPLTLTCLTFQSAARKKPLVLIGADLGWWKSREDEWFFRGGVLQALSIDPSRLMFCLSHTHSGPSIFQEDSPKPGGHLITPFLRFVREAAISAARRALKSAVPASLKWRYGKCDLARNRDLPERQGRRFVCGFNPGATSDDTLLAGRVTSAAGKIMATIVNYACHPTTLAWENRLISPDYVGAMRETVECCTNAPCLFLQGASGELAPAEQYSGDVELADAHGRQLGHAVLSTLEGMLPAKMQLRYHGVVESGAPLAVWQRAAMADSRVISWTMVEVPLPLKPLPPLQAIEQEWRACQDSVLKERLWRKRSVRKIVGDGRVSEMPLWVWRLGDSCLIGQPNEPYSDFQATLRQALSPYPIAVMSLVNCNAGYLPPRNRYGKNLYQIRQTPFAAGALEMLTKTALRTARRAMAGAREKL